MPGVMDIKHLLCHPCEPNPPKLLKTTHKSSLQSESTTSMDYDMLHKRRKRVNSETTFKEYNRHLRTIMPRRKSTSNNGLPSQLRVAWTPMEDDLLQQGYEQGLSWGMISSTYLPHRSRGCCWGRFKMLQSKQVITPPPQRFLGRPWRVMN